MQKKQTWSCHGGLWGTDKHTRPSLEGIRSLHVSLQQKTFHCSSFFRLNAKWLDSEIVKPPLTCTTTAASCTVPNTPLITNGCTVSATVTAIGTTTTSVNAILSQILPKIPCWVCPYHIIVLFQESWWKHWFVGEQGLPIFAMVSFDSFQLFVVLLELFPVFTVSSLEFSLTLGYFPPCSPFVEAFVEVC